MASSLTLFIEENFPGIEFKKIGAYNMMLNTILIMEYQKNPELREKGKQVANQMISVIEEADNDGKKEWNDALLILAYSALGRLAEADGTKDGYDMAVACFEKVRDWWESEGDETEAMDNRIDMIKAKRDGDADRVQFSEASLASIQVDYEKSVKEKGEGARNTMQMGINLVQAYRSASRTIECEQLAKKLATTSRQVYGPEHPFTKELKFYLTSLKRRTLGVYTENGVLEYEVLRPAEEEGKYIVKGPSLQNPRNLEEEAVLTVPVDDYFTLAPGTPVICHGLINAAHLNGKIGEAASLDHKTDRYVVRFQDKSQKSALVKPGNLRIVFDLPDE